MRFYGENLGEDQKLRKNPKKQTKKRSRNNGKKPTGKKSEVRIIIGIFVLSTPTGTEPTPADPETVLI